VWNGLPARTAVYQHRGDKYQSEFTIIAAESISFEIIVFPAQTNAPLDEQTPYVEYAVKMRDSFQVGQAATRNR
jgi:hypothetical protein